MNMKQPEFRERGVFVTIGSAAVLGLAGLTSGVLSALLAGPAVFGLMAGITMIFVDPSKRY